MDGIEIHLYLRWDFNVVDSAQSRELFCCDYKGKSVWM